MRRAARRDATEPEIMRALAGLRDADGRTLVPFFTAVSDEGYPDLSLFVRGAGWLLMEVKMAGEKLTAAQVRFWRKANGAPGVVVDSSGGAIESVRAFAYGRSLEPWAWWHFAPKGTSRPAEVRR